MLDAAPLWVVYPAPDDPLDWQSVDTSRLNDIAPLADGSSIGVGYVDRPRAMGPYPLKEVWVVKLDPDGNTVWSKTYGGANHEEGYAVAVDGSGNILVTGPTWSADSPVLGDFDTTSSLPSLGSPRHDGR